ncbi:PTS lactose/cellobiose transporter subunit IIA [Proteiniclasticum sp. C24MP]|uniref:PTS lactose/cellobiose transporter subunit IIA n=1 Tax=Proteiniclasticum sp. C24MP TaxID=3374101 RepID=UPI003754D432
MEDLEVIIMQLITYAGDARSLAIEAIRMARKSDFHKADDLLVKCNETIIKAHSFQTELIIAESNGNKMSMTLLMVHAQDHVMNALTIKEIAFEMVENMKQLKNKN